MPLLITSVSLVHYCCTHRSHSTASSPNANTGLRLPIIISTLSKTEGNAICNRFGGAHNSLEGDDHTACWFYDQFKLVPWQTLRPSDWPWSPFVFVSTVVGQEMLVRIIIWTKDSGFDYGTKQKGRTCVRLLLGEQMGVCVMITIFPGLVACGNWKMHLG